MIHRKEKGRNVISDFANYIKNEWQEEQARNKYSKKKKSGQIPAFGNWDYANELPITQYFESARQAGLIRFSKVSSAADSESAVHARAKARYLYTQLHFHNYSNYNPPLPPKTKVLQPNEYRSSTLEQEKKSSIGDYIAEPPRQSKLTNKNDRGFVGDEMRVPHGKRKHNTNIKNIRAVDEDLYKIPPQLLQSSQKKKRLGFFLKCLAPVCRV